MQTLSALLLHPATSVALTLVLTVWAWKMNASSANWMLVLAWVIAAFAVFRTLPSDVALIVRGLIVMIAAGVVGLALYVNLWTNPAPAKAATAVGEVAPPPGLRARQIQFSEPVLNERVFAVVNWENTSDRNITATMRTAVFTSVLLDGAQLPITPADEQAYEEHGEDALRTAEHSPPAEHGPGARFVGRYGTDPAHPLTQREIDDLAAGRSRIYVRGVASWQVDGVEHGCHFCAWTSAGGFGRLCNRGNRCY